MADPPRNPDHPGDLLAVVSAIEPNPGTDVRCQMSKPTNTGSSRSGMFLLPYSPRWLAKQGRPEEAKAALIRLHGGANRARTDVVEAEFAEMEMQIEWGGSSSSAWMISSPCLVAQGVLTCDCRARKPQYQLQRSVQHQTQLAPNGLWRARPGHDPVDWCQRQVGERPFAESSWWLVIR